MKAVEKIKGWYEEHNIEVKLITSIAALSAGCITIGYIVGEQVCADRVNRALGRMFEVTPEFKEQYAEALYKACMIKFIES